MDWVLTKPRRKHEEKASCFNGRHVHCVGNQGPPHPTWGTRKCLQTMCGVPPEKLNATDEMVVSVELFDTYEEGAKCDVCAFKRAKARRAPR